MVTKIPEGMTVHVILPTTAHHIIHNNIEGLHYIFDYKHYEFSSNNYRFVGSMDEKDVRKGDVPYIALNEAHLGKFKAALKLTDNVWTSLWSVRRARMYQICEELGINP